MISDVLFTVSDCLDSPYDFWRLVYSVWLSGQSLWFLTFCLVFYCLGSPYDFWRLVYSVWLSGQSLWFLTSCLQCPIICTAHMISDILFRVSYCLDSPYDFLVVYGLLFWLPLWLFCDVVIVCVCLSGQPLWFVTFCLEYLIVWTALMISDLFMAYFLAALMICDVVIAGLPLTHKCASLTH